MLFIYRLMLCIEHHKLLYVPRNHPSGLVTTQLPLTAVHGLLDDEECAVLASTMGDSKG